MSFEHRVEIGTLPRDIESYLALRDRLAVTPQGGAAMLVVAMLIHVEEKELGARCLTATLDPYHLVDSNNGLQGKAPSPAVLRTFRERIDDRPWIVRSYIEGTSPEQGYQLPVSSLVVRIREQSPAAGTDAKVFVFSSGADSPRPTRLIKSPRGFWKAKEWSSLEVGVRPPVKAASPADDI